MSGEWIKYDGPPKHLPPNTLIERERYNGPTTTQLAENAYWPNTRRWRTVGTGVKLTKGTTAMATKSLIYRFKSGTVVDRTMFNALSNEKLAETMAELYEKGAPTPVFVENTNDFFSKSNLLKQVSEAGEHLAILLEKWQIELTAEQLETLNKFTAIKKDIADEANRIKVPYPFAAVPEGWSVETQLNINTARVMRKNSNYTIGIKTLENLWKRASGPWKEGLTYTGYIDVQASGYRRSATFNRDSITIGCQTLQRYEVEQVALHLGWEFPE